MKRRIITVTILTLLVASAFIIVLLPRVQALTTYNVSFSQNGLPSAAWAVWSVTLNGQTESSNSPGNNWALITFTEPDGAYSYTVTPPSGYAASPSSGSVTVNGKDPSIVQITFSTLSASASATPTSGYAPLSVQFTGSASDGSSPYSYSWSFGDGSSSNQQNPSHTYQNAGSYTATLTVTDSIGNTAAKSVTITVSSQQAVYTVTINSGSGGSVSYSCSYGSGTVSSGHSVNLQVPSGTQISLRANPDSQHVFGGWSTSGSVYVWIGTSASTTLTVNGIGEATAGFVLNLNIGVSTSPSAATIQLGNSVHYTALASGGSGTYTDYVWYWIQYSTANQGSHDSGSSNTYTFTPSQVGSYGVYVVVTDSSGNTAQSLSSSVTVQSTPPPSTSSLQVLVYDEQTGNPIQGATVTMTSAPSGQNLLSGTTDSSGQYTFQNIQTGSYSVQATASGYSPGTGSATAQTSQTVAITIILATAAPRTLTVPDNYPTLQAAIDAANPGDTVYVKAGTYFENVVVDKIVSLVGENSQNTIINGSRWTNSGYVLSIGANGVSITGFAICSGAVGVWVESSSNDNIVGNRITNNHVGIWLDSCSNISVAGNEVTASYYNVGVYLVASSNVNVAGDNITNNSYGVVLYSSSNDNSITGNNITANGLDGVWITTNCNDNKVTGNDITANGWDGVRFQPSCNDNSVVENNIAENEWYGIWIEVSCDGNNIVGNNITANAWGGMRITESSGNSIVGNKVANHGIGVMLDLNSSANVFYHNNFVNNSQQASSGGLANVWDDGYPSGGNYWIDCAGIDVKSGPNQDQPGSDGIGDTPYTIDSNNIDHYPLMRPWGSPLPGPISVSISPTTVTMDVGQSQLFTSSVTGGTAPYTYQWYLDGTLVSGATSSTWTFTPTGAASHAVYSVYVKVADAASAVATSSTVRVSVYPQPSVTISPASPVMDVGESQLFTSTTLDGAWPFTFQWYLNGESQPGATGGQWTFTPTNVGSYTVQLQVTDSAGATSTSNTANVQVMASVNFTESGLAQGTEWSVTLDSETKSSTSDSIVFDKFNGQYNYVINSVIDYVLYPSNQVFGTVPVNGGNVKWPVAFIPLEVDTTWDNNKDSYNHDNTGTTWGADCYGMASTALLYFMHYTLPGYSTYPYFPCQNSRAASTSDLDLSGFFDSGKLNNASLAIMFHHDYLQYWRHPGATSGCNQYIYMLGNLTVGQPVVLIIWYFDANGNSIVHAVVAYKVVPVVLPNGVFSGSVEIYLYDPNYNRDSSRYATYDLAQGSFSYGDYHYFYAVNPFAMLPDSNLKLADYPPNYVSGNSWLSWGITNYWMVAAGPKSVTVLADNGAGECVSDYFLQPGNSQMFVCGIPGSSGIEEGNVQAYAVPANLGQVWVSDPGSDQSTILIMHLDNESGQLVAYGYLLNAATTQSPLNCIVIPSSAGLSIISGSEAFNVNVTFFFATQQEYSIFQASDIPVGAMQKLNFTVTNWQMLNSTSPPSVTLTSSRADIPPTTTLAIRTPKYVDSSGNIYVSSATPFVLSAEDNLGGIGVASTLYRIYNGTYDKGWLSYAAPFNLTGLSDGVYSIQYCSTDKLGNVETTHEGNVTLFSWNYVFKDSDGRGTVLKISTAYKFFQFTAPAKDFGVKYDSSMVWLCKQVIIICYEDRDMRLGATAVDARTCLAIAYDRQACKNYWLIMHPPVPKYTLTIFCKDSRGQAVLGASVYLNGNLQGVTDSGGKLTVPNLTAGTYAITVKKNGYKNTSVNVTMSSDKTITITMK